MIKQLNKFKLSASILQFSTSIAILKLDKEVLIPAASVWQTVTAFVYLLSFTQNVIFECFLLLLIYSKIVYNLQYRYFQRCC